MIGDSVLHGPHHGAQKSTRTGWRRDSSRTSAAKPFVVVSLIRSVPAGAAGLAAARALGTSFICSVRPIACGRAALARLGPVFLSPEYGAGVRFSQLPRRNLGRRSGDIEDARLVAGGAQEGEEG